MKTKTPRFYLWSLILGLLLSPMPLALSQIPQGFNYQAIARDGSGNILQNTPLQVMFYVQSLQTGGTLYWKEWHSPVTTNNFGLFNLVVGNGTRQTESTVATFNLIDWSITPKYLKTEIYYSGSWKDLGTSQLMSVPYALTSGDLAGTVDKLSVKGTTSGLEEALFEVKNKDGQTVFAVYNEGVRIYVSDGAKAVKGGFAVGGFGTDKAESTKYLFVGKDSVRIFLDTNPLTKKLKGGFAVGGYDLTKGTIQDYLDVNSDSVRIYIDSNPSTKKVKGGFAVGGYDMTKAGQEEYLRVTRDSTRVYVNNSPTKAIKGGFAVGGFDVTKGTPVTPFTLLTPENYFIGHKSGINNTSGKFNSYVGFESGLNGTTASSNTIMGYQSGYNLTTGSYNVFLGQSAGYNDTASFNVFIGFESGKNTISGINNVMLGYQSGFSNISGVDNIFIGKRAGFFNSSSSYNIFLGYEAGYNNGFYGVSGNQGSYNTFFGYQSGIYNYRGANNVYLGYKSGMGYDTKPTNDVSNNNVAIGNYSGQNLLEGSDNVFAGTNAGYSNKYGWWNVFIGTNAGYKNTGSPTSGGGSQNVFIGQYAGYENIQGFGNICIGFGAGRNNTTNSNVFIGRWAGTENTTGKGNVFIGNVAGSNNTESGGNVFIGESAGKYNDSTFNTFIGYEAGINNRNGISNVFAGSMSGAFNRSGFNNTYIGYKAGFSNESGSGNICIGSNAGYFETGSNKFYLDNSDTIKPLIKGDFTEGLEHLIFNGNVGVRATTPLSRFELGEITQTTNILDVQRDVAYSSLNISSSYVEAGFIPGLIWRTSDNNPTKPKAGIWCYNDGSGSKLVLGTSNSYITGITNTALVISPLGRVGIGTLNPGTKLSIPGLETTASGSQLVINGGNVYALTSLRNSKKDISPLKDDFNKILGVNPVSFTDKVTGLKGIGYIAEEFELAGLQNLLVYENEKLVSLRYDLISVYNLELIKEQKQQIDSYKSENDNLKSQLQILQEEVKQIKSMLAKGDCR
jgi:hypothetical protein